MEPIVGVVIVCDLEVDEEDKQKNTIRIGYGYIITNGINNIRYYSDILSGINTLLDYFSTSNKVQYNNQNKIKSNIFLDR